MESVIRQRFWPRNLTNGGQVDGGRDKTIEKRSRRFFVIAEERERRFRRCVPQSTPVARVSWTKLNQKRLIPNQDSIMLYGYIALMALPFIILRSPYIQIQFKRFSVRRHSRLHIILP